MSEQRIIRVCAPAGVTFTPKDASGMVDQEVPLLLEGEPFSTARCVAAEVELPLGRAIRLTLEADRWPDLGAPTFLADVSLMEVE